MTILEQVANHIVNKNFSTCEREEAFNHILDSLTALICGRFSPEGEKLYLTFKTDEKSSMYFESNGKTGDLDNLLLYSSFTRLTEVDDIHLSSCTTPGSVIIPTLLVLTQSQKDLSFESILDALIVGYDTMTRLGQVIDGPNILRKGIWPTYFCAAFGSAATTSRILGLSVDETVHALALALTMSTGGVSRSSELSFRWVTLGHAARSGAFAAIMASKGLTGDPKMLDSDWLTKTYGIDSEPSRLLMGLGNQEVMNKISMKPYCSAKQVIPSLYGLTRVLESGINPEEIKEIRIKVPNEFVEMINHGAFDRMSSLTSAPYQLAMLGYFPEKLFDISRNDLGITDEVQLFMDKVQVFGDEGLSMYYPEKWMTQVEVVTSKNIFIEKIESSPGDPEKKLTKEAIINKTTNLFYHILDQETARDYLQLLEGNFETKQSIIKLFTKVLTIIA
jgi:2-methylcitrate dehydratase PrpD